MGDLYVFQMCRAEAHLMGSGPKQKKRAVFHYNIHPILI